MFNFGTIGAYKQVRNNPRTKVKADTKNGQVLVLDEAKGEASFPNATEAKGKDLWVAFNIVDKPEIRNTNEFKIEAGEFVRAFYLADLVGLPVLVGNQVIDGDYADVEVGDILAPKETTGLWEVVADASDYAITLEVIKKTTFADGGVEAIVRA